MEEQVCVLMSDTRKVPCRKAQRHGWHQGELTRSRWHERQWLGFSLWQLTAKQYTAIWDAHYAQYPLLGANYPIICFCFDTKYSGSNHECSNDASLPQANRT